MRISPAMHCFRLVVALTVVFALSAVARAQDVGRNLDFEAGGTGIPAGWNEPDATPVAASPLYELGVDDDHSHGGKYSLRMAFRGEARHMTADYGRLRQAVPADAFRGKCVRLTGWLRTSEISGGFAGLFLRIDGHEPNGALVLDNMSSYGLSGTNKWTQCEITLKTPDEAQRITFGVSLVGNGIVWADDLNLAAVECDTSAVDPPRALEGRALDNLVAFTRLLGYVRYFHPSDQAAAADWDAFAIDGVRAVEAAASPDALARALQDLFAKVAPTVRVVVTGTKLELPPELATPPTGNHRILAWEHLGCGIGTANGGQAYKSERVPCGGGMLLRWLGGKAHSNPPKIDEPWTVDLPGGVTVAVPLALYADDGGTLPHAATPTSSPAAALASDKTEVAPGVVRRVSANLRATRLAAVALAWNVPQHFYPYFDVVKTDWDAALREALQSAAVDPDEQAFLATLRRLIAALHDGHGRVGHVADRNNATLPIALDFVDQDVVVTRVHESLEGQADIKPGDVIEAFNGQPTAEVVAKAEKLISAATPQWMRDRLTFDLRLGPRGETCVLRLRRDGTATHDVTLTYGGEFVAEKRPEKIAELRPGVWYIDIDRIDDKAFNDALDDLKEARGLIFDLRGYPNQLSTVVLSHLIDDKIDSPRWNTPIVTRPDRQNLDWQFNNWPVPPIAPRLTKNVAFITGGGAISYAETYMGMVENYKLGQIVGEATAGTNGNVNPFTLPGGYTVYWTGMKVLKQDGSQHHGVGIQPTVPVKRTLAGIRAGRDEFLDRALELVSRAIAEP